MMKKAMMIPVVLILILGIGTTSVLAKEYDRRGNFVDQNSDGICDNREDGKGRS